MSGHEAHHHHLAMNHSAHGMDHTSHGLDHLTHSHGDMHPTAVGGGHGEMHHERQVAGAGHGHSMIFHFGYSEVVLFQCWQVNSYGTLVASIFGIILLSALYEGVKYFREYLFWRACNGVQYRAVQISNDKNNATENAVVEVIHKQPVTMLSHMHLIQTLLHIIQMTISYMLMLIFMTYNVWLCFAVVIGAAIGYFLFGWKKSVVVDVTEHCH